MSILYINKAHGLPDLDLELTISGTSVTAKLYSANNAGGYFNYEAGIEYAIYAGGTGFTINSGAFFLYYKRRTYQRTIGNDRNRESNSNVYL